MAEGGSRPQNEPSRTETDADLSEADLASELMGNNQLHGEDQEQVHNERQAVAGVKLEPDDGPVESAKMLDKTERAKAELGQGNRHHPDHPKNADGDEE